jgi:hypothetical protein
MVIAPSKLGVLVAALWKQDDALVQRLREAGLVRDDIADADVRATFRRAREEDDALTPEEREYNSPNERVRVFLGPFLTAKGLRWAEPFTSMSLPDD